MSTPEHKVEVIHEWLIRQATQRRFTNPVEVAQYAGLALAEKGYREHGSSNPISREAVFEALHTIAVQSYQDDGFILPALVVHFSDKKPGHRFFEWANELEQVAPEMELGAEYHVEQLDKIFARYGTPVPEDASSLT